MLYDRVGMYEFFTMRTLCRMFWKESFNNQCHWVQWLHWYGRKQNKKTLILKTVPLYTQVFEQSVDKMLKRHERQFNVLSKATDVLRDKLIVVRSARDKSMACLQVSTKDAAELKLQRARRKRRRINLNISKTAAE